MMCRTCGAAVGEGDAFCAKCGARAGATPTPAPSARETRASNTPAGATLSGDRTRILPEAAVLEPGGIFHDRYRIERLIGQGGMGAVYLASDQVTGDRVCLKVIRPDLMRSQALAKRFLREGTVTRGLRHPNVVAVYDVNVAGESYYLSMEYLEGKTLRQWIQRNLAERRNVPLEVARRILKEILDGLGAAHRADLIHRDLKPENVMLLGEPLDGPFALKILDFGVARPLHTREQLTVEGASMGTPVYMAPEQETSADLVGPEADLYSAGVIFYEILLGVPPRGRWDLPSEVRPELPPAVDDVCTGALHAHPARRFQSVSEFLTALDGIGSAPRAAQAAGPAPKAPKPARPAPARPVRAQPRGVKPPTRPRPLPPRPAKQAPGGSVAAAPPPSAPPPSGSAPRAGSAPRPQSPAPGYRMALLLAINIACAVAGMAISGWLAVEGSNAFPSVFRTIGGAAGLALAGLGTGIVTGLCARKFAPGFGTRRAAIWAVILAGAFASLGIGYHFFGPSPAIRVIAHIIVFAAVAGMTIAQVRSLQRAPV